MRALSSVSVLVVVAVMAAAGVAALDSHAHTHTHGLRVRTRGRKVNVGSGAGTRTGVPHKCCCRVGGVFAVGPIIGFNKVPVLYTDNVECGKQGGRIVEWGVGGDNDPQNPHIQTECEKGCKHPVGKALSRLAFYWDHWSQAHSVAKGKYQSAWDQVRWKYPNRLVQTPAALQLATKQATEKETTPYAVKKPEPPVKGKPPAKGENGYDEYQVYLSNVEQWKLGMAAHKLKIEQEIAKAVHQFKSQPEVAHGVTTEYCRQHLARVQTAIITHKDYETKCFKSTMLGIALDDAGNWWGTHSGDTLSGGNMKDMIADSFAAAGDNEAATYGVKVENAHFVDGRIGKAAEQKIMKAIADYDTQTGRTSWWRKDNGNYEPNPASAWMKAVDAVNEVSNFNFGGQPAPLNDVSRAAKEKARAALHAQDNTWNLGKRTVQEVDEDTFSNEKGHLIGNCAAQKLFYNIRKAGANVVCLAEGWLSCKNDNNPVGVATANGAIEQWSGEQMVPSCATCQGVCPALLAARAHGILNSV